MTNNITNDYYLNTSKYKYTNQTDNGALGKDAFLQILIAQLQNQDPTSPMDDKEFIAQMAQFSSLEQMQNMTSAMKDLLESQQQTQLMSYTNFIGKEVKWNSISEELDEKGKPIISEGVGVVTELKFKDNKPTFVLDNGKEIDAGNISSVLANGTGQAVENPFVQASQLIGKSIQYTKDGSTVQAIIESITNKNGVIEYILNNGSRVNRDQFELLSDVTNEDKKSE